ncbi:hypothetical protein MG293_020648 [Ovis ammon polii]|uniref:Uncharacterized protein n=1 Tax=Ovis ammon polii TaxID=230172 RepID=A0AAD4TPS7_OVIAM|nr:hypothetical protein MG293_020648 [Ovis ammon polii]
MTLSSSPPPAPPSDERLLPSTFFGAQSGWRKEAISEGMWVSVKLENNPQSTAPGKQVPQSYNHMELNSASNMNELGSEYVARASREGHRCKEVWLQRDLEI